MKKIYIYPTKLHVFNIALAKLKRSWKIIFLSLLTSVLRPPASFSQTAPGIEWQNTIGGTGDDKLNSIQQTSDGGYILGGYSNSNITGDKTENSNGADDYWIIKTDAVGNIQWQNTIGGNNFDRLYSLQQTSDGGYILGGVSLSGASGDKTEICYGSYDYWIVKTDAAGNIQWQNAIGGNHFDYLYSIQQTFDGGYILGGHSNSDSTIDKTENSYNMSYDMWIVKTDSTGIVQWQNTIGGSSADYLYSIKQTADSGYILGGHSNSDSSFDKTENCYGGFDYWIVKTDAGGNIQWQNTIGGSNNDNAYSIQQTADGGYMAGGYSKSDISGDKTENCIGITDYWILKMDATGNIQWQNTIGGNIDDILNSVEQTTDGGYLLGGWSKSGISGDKTENCIGEEDYWIVKTDSAGTVQWENTLGGDMSDYCNSLHQVSDGGYILAGYSRSGISGDKTENTNGNADYWIIKLHSDTITGIPNYQLPITNYQFSPNPLTTQSKLTFKNTNKEKFLFILYDITGRIIETVSTTNNEIILTKDTKHVGVYLFNLENEKTGERWNGKIVITD